MACSSTTWRSSVLSIRARSRHRATVACLFAGTREARTKRQCGRKIVSNLLETRIPPSGYSNEEVEGKLRLVSLAQKEGDPFEEGIRLALEAVLASPDFLFRSERASKAVRPASSTDHELASRLSYFLWSSMPDDELRSVLRTTRLCGKPGVLNAQVRRMLADPKASNLVDNFAAQWLQLRNLGRTKPDPARFPTVDDELLDAMRRETSLFVEAIIREDRSILDLIDAPFTFLNGPLARHYGIGGVTGEEFRRVDLDARTTQRAAYTRSDSDSLVVSDTDIATGARKVGAGESSRLGAAAASAGCAGAGRIEAWIDGIIAGAIGAASQGPKLLALPQPDGSHRLWAGELRRGRSLAYT